jgi:hypothetical protein
MARLQSMYEPEQIEMMNPTYYAETPYSSMM